MVLTFTKEGKNATWFDEVLLGSDDPMEKAIELAHLLRNTKKIACKCIV